MNRAYTQKNENNDTLKSSRTRTIWHRLQATYTDH